MLKIEKKIAILEQIEKGILGADNFGLMELEVENYVWELKRNGYIEVNINRYEDGTYDKVYKLTKPMGDTYFSQLKKDIEK